MPDVKAPVVDDQPLVQEMVNAVLLEATEALNRLRGDLVISELWLPGRSDAEPGVVPKVK